MDERPISHRAAVGNDIPGRVAVGRTHHYEVASAETRFHARAFDDEVRDRAAESLRREQKPRGKRRRQCGAYREQLAHAEPHHRTSDRLADGDDLELIGAGDVRLRRGRRALDAAGRVGAAVPVRAARDELRLHRRRAGGTERERDLVDLARVARVECVDDARCRVPADRARTVAGPCRTCAHWGTARRLTLVAGIEFRRHQKLT
jgi:hypothetical protein